MTDKLNEVGKELGRIKRNSEAALRRYNPKQPKIERARDVFDDVIPFEMEFETDEIDKLMFIDLYFNKPPPLKGCNGRYTIPCEDFALSAGDHLIQVTSRYKPGSVTVFRDNVKLSSPAFYEYDPINGLVWVQGSEIISVFNICYVRDTWVTCDPTYIATAFYGDFSSSFGDWVPNYTINPAYDDLVAQYGIDFSAEDYSSTGVWTHINNVTQSIGESQSIGLVLSATLPSSFSFPSAQNLRLSYTFSIAGTTTINETHHAELDFAGVQVRLNLDNDPGLYVANGGPFQKISSALAATVIIDNNLERGTLIVSGPGFHIENSAYTSPTFSLGITHAMQIFGTYGANSVNSTASLTGFEIGCSLESL